jgi:DNA-binding transcriptional MerR regulator
MPNPDRSPAARGAALTTARLCAAASATRGMLRLYEAEGLLAPPGRSAAGYRHYPADTVDRVQAIRLLKELGFTLRDIALLLSERDGGALDAARLQALAAAQLTAIDARMARLALVRRYIAAVAAGDLAQLQDDAECQFLVDFMAAAPIALSMPPMPPTASSPLTPFTPLPSWAESAS